MRLLDLVVKNVRGLPGIHLQPDGNNLVIWGPNGAGKSGVVDAIDFIFTGRISRLEGRGTAGITLTQHGPHIDHDPESAVVTATVKLEGIADPITFSRCMARPGEIVCSDEVRGALIEIGEIVRRGAIVLTRRDVLRYIAAEAGTRADEIQELLNLMDIESIRNGIYRARTELRRNEQNAQKAVSTAEAEVNVTLGAPKYNEERLIELINECRAKLGGDPIDVLQSAVFKKGLAPPAPTDSRGPAFNRTLFQQTMNNINIGTREEIQQEIAKIDKNLRLRLAKVKAHKELLIELEKLELSTHAMRFVNETTTECPVCGAPWPEGHLKQHLQEKITAAREAEVVKQNIAKDTESIAIRFRNLRANIESLVKTISSINAGIKLNVELKILSNWQKDIDRLIDALDKPIESYLDSEIAEASVAHLLAPKEFAKVLSQIQTVVQEESPAPTQEQTAWDTLTRLEESMRALENRNNEKKDASKYRSRVEALFTEYESERDTVLQDLYARIATRFVEFYGLLHQDESGQFTAQLQPQGASLKFEVDFRGRGSHPPHALHSEGHQDSMGVCLFLALNEELSEGKIDLVVLDDVMMSVDISHRKDICRLLREIFPGRQFIITTHDKTWAKQLKQETIIKPEQLIEFTGWTISSGPQVHQQLDLWQEAETALAQDDVHEAAQKLRRGSEDHFESACDSLGAAITYNSATQWQLDDWLPAAIDRYKALLQRARRSASSWNNQEALAMLNELESVRKQIYGRTFAEQWAINAAVHYNNWENMSKEEFSDVVDAFRYLHSLFVCSVCGGMLQTFPRKGNAEIVKCPCGNINWNLKQKPNN